MIFQPMDAVEHVWAYATMDVMVLLKGKKEKPLEKLLVGLLVSMEKIHKMLDALVSVLVVVEIYVQGLAQKPVGVNVLEQQLQIAYVLLDVKMVVLVAVQDAQKAVALAPVALLIVLLFVSLGVLLHVKEIVLVDVEEHVLLPVLDAVVAVRLDAMEVVKEIVVLDVLLRVGKDVLELAKKLAKMDVL